MSNLFKSKVKESLVSCVKDYSFLLDKEIVLESNKFKYCNKYVLRFDKSNFLHLTGVITILKPASFFDKCINEQINENDFYYSRYKNKSTIKRKLKNLKFISNAFSDMVYVQELFIKNHIFCKIATSNEIFTIGFIGDKYLYPNTILDKNHLDTNKTIKVMPKIIIR